MTVVEDRCHGGIEELEYYYGFNWHTTVFMYITETVHRFDSYIRIYTLTSEVTILRNQQMKLSKSTIIVIDSEVKALSMTIVLWAPIKSDSCIIVHRQDIYYLNQGSI